jgi:chemotaxis protein MotB
MYSNSKKLFFVALSAILLSSCVAERRFQDEVSARAKAEEERARLKSENIDVNALNADLEDQMKNYDRQLEHLRKDTAVMSTSLNRLTTNYDKLNDTYERLLEQMGKLREGNAEDTKTLTRELQNARQDIQVREDQLHKLELALANREGNLDAMGSELDKSKAALEEKRLQLMVRSKRINDLESVLARKDSAVLSLKNNIANALLGFADQGLTVEQKNGKVYVSLEEQLLFKSGSWVVDTKGQDALKKLGKVLETQSDVSILIEGHTDNVPYKGSGAIEDNWDLSVKRATAIVKILTANSSIDPKQLSAAGRSEYSPLNTEDTKEAKAENRRTEIIITPKLNELFKILESN